MERRQFIKVAAVSNMMLAMQFLAPSAAAKIDREVFMETTADGALAKILGEVNAEESDKIMLKVPESPENGGAVPVEVTTELEGAQRIVVLVNENPTPLVGEFIYGEGVNPNIKTRCRIAKPSDVTVLVAAGDKIYSTKKHVKVTKGGC